MDRLNRLFSPKQLDELQATFLSMIGSQQECIQVGLSGPVAMDTALIDGTCIEANIHHPMDWTLLGDVARTLLVGLDQIRKRGILNRIPWAPGEFSNRFNELSIEMTHTRRRKDGQKARKNVLRRKKRLPNSFCEHTRRHLLLDKGWKEAGFHPGEYRQLKGRVEKMLELLPKVIYPAHERMIAGRKVHNSVKILSAYDADVQVLVRGKFGKEVNMATTVCWPKTRPVTLLIGTCIVVGRLENLSNCAKAFAASGNWISTMT